MKDRLAELVPLLRMMKDRELASLASVNRNIEVCELALDALSSSRTAEERSDYLRSMTYEHWSNWVVQETSRIHQKLALLFAEKEDRTIQLRRALGRAEVVQKYTAKNKIRSGGKG